MSSKLKEAKLARLVILGGLSDLPEEDREAVESLARIIRLMIAENGEAMKVAITLVMLELGIEQAGGE